MPENDGNLSVAADQVPERKDSAEKYTCGSHKRTTLLQKWQLVQGAIRDSRLKPADVSVLAVVLERINSKSGYAWPSLNTIAEDACSNRSTVKRSMRRLVEFSYLKKTKGDSTRSTRYRIGSGGRLQAPTKKSFGGCLKDQDVGVEMLPKVGAAETPESFDLNPSNESDDTNNQIKSSKLIEKTSKGIAFSTWMDSIGNSFAIPADDAVFAYARNIGLPLEMIHLAWHEFEARYERSPFRSKDWRIVFRNFVRRNTGKLWYERNEQFLLTTAGSQLMREVEHETGERISLR